jgi:ComF family protein
LIVLLSPTCHDAMRPSLKDSLLDLLYPSSCPVCGGGFAAPVCCSCLRDLASLAGAVDGYAGTASPAMSVEAFRSAGRYADSLKEMVLMLKGSSRAMAHPLAVLMSAAAGNDPRFILADSVCFVPSTRRKVARRGYNPARLLAVELSRILGRPLADALCTVSIRPDQDSVPGGRRWMNIAGSFGLADGAPPAGNVLLIDDVLTTGATAQECARLLLRGGASSVRVLVAAHAVLRRGSPSDFPEITL